MGQWQHLGVSSDMEHIRGIIGVEFRRLRNVHHIELYRTQEGVWAHWKQYVTTEAWSKPLLLMHDDQVVLLSRLKPPGIPHAFNATQVDGFTNFLKQLERVLSASGRFEQFQSGLEWLQAVGTNRGCFSGASIDEILADLRRMGSAFPIQQQGALPILPDDVLLAVAPGADIGPQPSENLVTVDGVPGGATATRKDWVTPGDLVIIAGHKNLPFNMGVLMDFDDWLYSCFTCFFSLPGFFVHDLEVIADGCSRAHPAKSFFVQAGKRNVGHLWLFKSFFVQAGKRKCWTSSAPGSLQMRSLFMKWRWCLLQSDSAEMCIELVHDVFKLWGHVGNCHDESLDCFPWLRVAADQILEWDFALEGQDSNEIPFSVLDALMDTHGMDLTGLKWSATVRGTRFRTHRLMPWPAQIGKWLQRTMDQMTWTRFRKGQNDMAYSFQKRTMDQKTWTRLGPFGHNCKRHGPKLTLVWLLVLPFQVVKC